MLLIGLVLAILSYAVFASQVSNVHAQGSAITIQPSSQASLPVNSLLTFNVTVENMPFNFAGWDITVVTNPAVLSPQSIAVCNTTACNVPYSDSGGTNFMPGGTDAQCINGTPSGAFNTCTGNDGIGVAHDAFASSGFTGGALLLFTITYKVMASGTTNVVLGPDLAHPESTTGTTNHLFDTSGLDIIASETGGSYNVVLHSTSTSVNCTSPVGVGSSSACTATVTDTSSSPTTAGSSVIFTVKSGSGTFSGSSSGTCVLSGSGSSASCQVTYTPTSVGSGTHTLNATYNGDSSHQPSSATTTVTVTKGSSSTTSRVINEATGSPPSGSEVTGASFHDTAAVSGLGATPSGTVSYTFYTNGGCTGTGTSQTVTLNSAGVVPNSVSTGGLSPGSYSYNVTYSGDANYLASTSGCEPFSVTKAVPTVASVVVLKSGIPLPSPALVNSIVNDTSSVTGITGFVPSGSLVYGFFNNGGCTAPAASTQTVSLNPTGGVPNSDEQGPLAQGTYSFDATYSGDSNYVSKSVCEPFNIGQLTPTISTIVLDASTNAAWSGSEVTGTSANDTATVSGSGPTPSGTVTYTFYANGGCTGLGAPEAVTMANGAVPHSSSTSALGAGSYSYKAHYSGDTNYLAVDSVCETFGLAKAFPTIVTDVSDATTNGHWSGSETTGAVAFDTATVTGVTGLTPSGAVRYTFYGAADCTGTGSPETVTLTGSGTVPNSANTSALTTGSYSYNATYSGDSNYLASTSGCEAFTVREAVIAPVLGPVSLSPSSVAVGQKVGISLDVTNSASTSQTITVRARWGAITVAEQNVTLNAGEKKPVSLTWDTSGYGPGTANVTIIIPQSGTVENAGPLTLTSPGFSLSSIILLLVAAGSAAVIVVVSAVVWLTKRGRRVGKVTPTA